MGGSYGSVQIRTDDRERVRRVAEEVVKTKQIKCLLGPALRGWVGVYPEKGGQDQTVGEEVARNLGGEVLHLLVHDDDVMAYWLWRDGALVDSYWSRPGYFGEEDRAEQEAMAGQPEAFAGLAAGTIDALRQLLRRDQEELHAFEEVRLGKFAALLGIPNAVTAYEYLKDGERDDIELWKQFEELPADEIAREKEARRQRRAQLTALKKRLKASGLLLAEVIAKSGGPLPYVAVAADGFAALWATPGAGALFAAGKKGEPPPKTSFEFHVSPWRKPQSIAIGLAPQVNSVCSDSTGSRLAVALGNRVIVVDTADWRLLREVPESNWAIGAVLSSDGRLLAHSSRHETVVTDVATGKRVKTVSGACHGVAFHPSGRWLLTVLPRWTIAITELDQQQKGRWRELWVGGSNLVMSARMILDQLQHMDPAAVGSQQQAKREAVIKQLEQLTETASKELSEEDVHRMREQVAKDLEMIAEQSPSLRAWLPQRRHNEAPRSLACTRDGRWLCCATDKGFYVFDWETVITAKGDDMPAPVRRYDIGARDESGQSEGHAYSIIQEADGPKVLFAGMTGELYRMDLQTGEVRLLLTMPDGGVIIQILISRDGQTLSILSQSGPDSSRSRSDDERRLWSLWSYPKLLEARRDGTIQSGE